MDTYSNILKAIGGTQGGLTAQQQADNYEAFSRLMKDGVYLPDLLKRVDTLEERLKELEKRPERSEADADLFAVMESAVRNDDAVRFARQRLHDERTRVLSEFCIRDEGYRKTFDEYRREVNAAYIRHKNGNTDITGPADSISGPDDGL